MISVAELRQQTYTFPPAMNISIGYRSTWGKWWQEAYFSCLLLKSVAPLTISHTKTTSCGNKEQISILKSKWVIDRHHCFPKFPTLSVPNLRLSTLLSSDADVLARVTLERLSHGWCLAPQWTQRNLARRFMKPIPFPAWSRQSLEYMRDFCFPNSDELLAPGKLRYSETKDCFQNFAGYHEIPSSKMKQRD